MQYTFSHTRTHSHRHPDILTHTFVLLDWHKLNTRSDLYYVCLFWSSQ